MAEPNALHPLMLIGTQSSNIPVWLTASPLGLYVQIRPVHIRLRALADLPIRYTVDGAGLPPGLALNPVTGVITGPMPTLVVDTAYSFTANASTAAGSSVRRFTLTGTVSVETQPLWQTPPGLIGEGTSGDVFIATLLAIDPTGLPVGYRLTANTALPAGLSFNVSTGVIKGILPSVTADTTTIFTVNATNGFYSVPRTFQITVLLNAAIAWITPAGSLSTQRQNTVVLKVLDAQAPDRSTISYSLTGGALPPGVTLDPPTGTLFGTLPFNTDPIDSYAFTVAASNGVQSIPRVFTITSLTTTAAVDPFAADVVLLSHFDGENNSQAFVDITGNRMTPSGRPIISSIEALFGGASGLFDGVSRLNDLPLPAHDFDLSATDYSIEYAVMFPVLPNTTVGQFQISAGHLATAYDGHGNFLLQTLANGASAATVVSLPWQPFALVWNRIAVVSANAVTTVYVDGQAIGNASGNTTLAIAPGGSTAPAVFGTDPGGHFMTGYLDEARVTRAARYLADYIPAAIPFPDLPHWTTASLPPAFSEVPYLAPLAGTDPNGDGLTFSVANGSVLPLYLDVANPAGTGPDGSAAGALEGMPLYAPNAATYSITLELTDGFNPADASFTLQVRPNPPPGLGYHGIPLSLGTYVERYPVATQILASDAAGLPLGYTADAMFANTGLMLNATSGAITGFAPLTPVGNVITLFTANVSSGAQAASATYSITFEHDLPPVWQSVTLATQPNAINVVVDAANTTALYTGYAGGAFPAATLHAIDPNTGQVVRYAASANAADGGSNFVPPFLVLQNTGVLTGALANGVTTMADTFSIDASDGFNIATATFVITALVCDPPIWVTPAGPLADVVPGTPYTVPLIATDPNTPALPLAYTLTGALPPGLTCNAATGVIAGLQTGVPFTTNFTFSVIADNGIKANSQDFSINVPFSHTLVWTTPGGVLINTVTGQQITATVTALSLDLGNASYMVSAGTLPAGLVLAATGATSASITGTAPPAPANDPMVPQYSAFDFTITASNGFASASEMFGIVIGDTLPVWTSNSALGTFYGAQTVAANVVAHLLAPVSWPLTYQLVSDPASLPPGLSLTSDGTLAGTLADVTANATSSFVANATDGLNATTRTFVCTIVPSFPPVWQTPAGSLTSNTATAAITWVTPPDLGNAIAETVYSDRLHATTGVFNTVLLATDPQGLPLLYSNIDVLPGRLSLGTDGSLTGSLLATDSGSFSVTVTDGIKSANQSFSVAGDMTINPLSYTISAGIPNGATFVSNALSGAVLSGTLPPVTADTTYTFTVTADNGVLAQARVFSLTSLDPDPYWATPNGVLYSGLGATTLPLANSMTGNAGVSVLAISPVGRGLSYQIDNVAHLPPGITLHGNSFTGILPEVLVDTTYQFIMNASDGVLPPIQNSYAITTLVNTDFYWQTPAGSIGSVLGNTTYNSTAILANSGSGLITYDISGGALPPGVVIANATPAQGSPILLTGPLAEAPVATDCNFTVTASTPLGTAIARGFSLAVLADAPVSNNSDFIDPFSAAVVLLLHFDGVDQSHVFYDEIQHVMKPLIAPGSHNEPGPLLSTVRAQHGVSALYLDGRTGLTTPDAPEFDFSTTDWTVECALYFSALPSIKSMIFACATFWLSYDQGQLGISYTPAGGSAPVTASFPVAFGTETWYSLAVVRGGRTLTLFVDGVTQGQADSVPDFAIPMIKPGQPWHFPVGVGERQTTGQPSGWLGAYVDELRVTRAARYASPGYAVSPYPFPDPPAFINPAGPLGAVLGGVQALLPLHATDPYGLGLEFLVTGGALPEPMNLLANGLIEGTPHNPTTDTSYSFTVTVSDTLNPVSRSFSIIDKFNFPPVWATPDGLLANVISGHVVAPNVVHATDPEGYKVSYSIVTGIPPLGTVFNTVSGAFTGTTLVAQATQDYVLIIAASDGVTPVTRTFSILSQANLPPVWVTPPGSLAAVYSGTATKIVLLATDSNNQPLAYRVISGDFPPGLSLNGKTGKIAGFPLAPAFPANGVTTFAFVLGASNGFAETPLAVSITVTPTLPPVILSDVATYNGLGGLPAVGSVSAIDPQGLPLTYLMAAPALPAPTTINPQTGVLEGVLANPPGGGRFPFKVTVTNQALTCSITDTYVIAYNNPPVWLPGGNAWAYPGNTAFAVTIAAIDPDGYPVTYSVLSALPPDTTYNLLTQVLSGTMPPAPVTIQYNFILGASDGVNLNAKAFILYDRYYGPPVFTSPATLPGVYLGQPGQSGAILISDNACEPVTFTYGGGLPSGMTADLTGSGGVPYSGTPGGSPGYYQFYVGATNSAGSALMRFTLPVVGLPRWSTGAGTIATWSPSNPSTNNIQSVRVFASSEINGVIEYALSGGALPPDCTLDPATGTISGVVAVASTTGNTTFRFNIDVNDVGYNNPATRAFAIVVTSTPPPSFHFSGGPSFQSTNWVTNQHVVVTIFFTDPAGYALTITVDGSTTPPDGISVLISGTTATINGYFAADVPSGSYAVTVTATDPFAQVSATALLNYTKH